MKSRIASPGPLEASESHRPRGDLLPWADPYITRLMHKHRLAAALDDSINYLKCNPGYDSRTRGNVAAWD